MAEYRDLLIEVGTEELPPKALRRLAEAFLCGVEQGLHGAELAFEQSRYYAAPRRLAIQIDRLVASQTDKEQERRGPALTASFDDDGMPTKAARGFARSCGVEVDQLGRFETEKGAWLVFRRHQPGQPTKTLIPEIVSKALAGLPIPKRMRWADLEDEFVRPVHWIVLLFGEEVIDSEILGVRTGRETRGHRFHHPGTLYLAEPAAYAPLLETEGHVIVDFEVRREAIRAQALEAAVAVGGTAIISPELLDEVASLVEWPVALCGKFEKRFLALPDEALISSMQTHQKYFPVKDEAGRLMPYFIAVANIESKTPEAIRKGNERVIRPRLEDAMFFYERDRKISLDERREELKNVIFQKQLGTLYDKVDRISDLTQYMANALGLDRETTARALRAANLSKCDLLTEMVGEFPELQGIMGREYAMAQGELSATALALDEQYMPRHAGDTVPSVIEGQLLAIADKLDTLCGIFAIGQPPTGDKDPFALRRAALGVLRIIIEREMALDLRAVINEAVLHFKNVTPSSTAGSAIARHDVASQVFNFMMDRLRAYYLDAGIRPDVFEAVLEREPLHPYDFEKRVRAVTRFRALPEAESLAAANKRIHNILRQASDTIPAALEENALTEDAERELYLEIKALEAEVEPLFARQDYEQALMRLAVLRVPVDGFFDKVMVMTDDRTLRRNRLALLKNVNTLFLRVADFSRLQG